MDVRILLFLALISVNQGYFIFMGLEKNYEFHKSKGICESNGMTLPILPTEDDYNQFVNISSHMYISVLGADVKVNTWIGLTMTGTDENDPSSYTWINGQTATYIDGDMTSEDPGKLCVRVMKDKMKRTSCIWNREIICQGDPQNRTELAPMLYTVNTNISFYGPADASLYYTVVSNEFEQPASVNLCPLEHSRTSLVHCFLVCLQRSSCSMVAILRDLSSCYIPC